MDPWIVAEIRRANEASRMRLTLMAMDDECINAAELVADEDVFGEKSTCMALAGFALSAASALAEQLKLPIETIIQTAATNAAMHTVELEKLLNKERPNDEGQD